LKGKKCEFLAKIGWRLVPEIARIRDWYTVGVWCPDFRGTLGLFKEPLLHL
jgi:hypothetical protein